MKAAVVSGICVDHDAISGAATGQAELLLELGFDQVVLFSQFHARTCKVPGVTVSDPWALVRHPEFVDADLVVVHWGIGYDLFDGLPLIAGRVPTAVHFHNVTPTHLVPEASRALMTRSLEQIQLPALTGTPFWTESDFNIETLVEWGFERESIAFMPFVIESPPQVSDTNDNDGLLRLLTVGRLVHAKGLDVLIRAMVRVVAEFGSRVSLVLAGDSAHSDGQYIAHLVELISTNDLEDNIRICDQLDDAALWQEYGRADVVVSPSLHEGLCVPVIEGYLSGCRVIGTDAGNLPFVVQPPDPVVPAGDSSALADSIISVGREVLASSSVVPTGAARLIARYSRSETKKTLAREVERLLGSAQRG